MPSRLSPLPSPHPFTDTQAVLRRGRHHDLLRGLPGDGSSDDGRRRGQRPALRNRVERDTSRFGGGSPESRKRRGEGRKRLGCTVHGDDEPFDPSSWLAFSEVTLWRSNHFAAGLPVGTTLVWIKRLDPAFGAFQPDAELAWMKGGHGVYCHRDTTDGGRGTVSVRSHPEASWTAWSGAYPR